VHDNAIAAARRGRWSMKRSARVRVPSTDPGSKKHAQTKSVSTRGRER
jgi:hypothetical protein